MKDWEINKVNELFARNDALQQQNNELKERAVLSSADQFVKSIKRMEQVLDQLVVRADSMEAGVAALGLKLENFKCDCDCTKTTKKAVVKKTK